MGPFNEICKSVLAWKIWASIGIEDVVGKYRRTMLGPLWIVFGQCAFIFGIYLVHKSVLGGGLADNYLLFLAVNLPVWTMIAQFLTEGCTSFLRSRGYIESYPLPLPIYVIRTVVSSFVTFLHMLPVFVVVAIVQHATFSISLLATIPALALLLLFGFGVGLGLASLTARYRDIGAALTAAIQLLFVVTPVFWAPNTQQKASIFVQLNPFYYLLEVVRQPAMNDAFSPHIWGIATGITLATTIVGVAIYRFMRPTVVYWL